LARKAASVRPRDTLPAWLHVVARRVALRARSAKARQFRATGHLVVPVVDPRPDPLSDLSARELLGIIDEELSRLPKAYRLPVILCCLEDRSVEEAARQLDWTAGSVKGRLERGRTRLHDRLVRRGLTLSAALAAAEASRGVTSAAELERLAAATVRGAVAFAARSTAVRDVSPAAVALAGEVTKGMAIARLKVLAALPLIVVTGSLALGISGVLNSDKQKPDTVDQQFTPLPELTGKGHWAVGKGTATLLEDGSIRLETKELGLWEIPWDHRSERFRLRVEVEDLAPATKGVGVYFGYAKHVEPQRTEHWFYEYCFAERRAEMPRSGTGPGQAEAHLYAHRYASGLIDSTLDPFVRQTTWGFPPQRGTRRLLTVECTPELVSAYWDKGSAPFMHITSHFFNRNVGRSLAHLEPTQKNPPSLFHPLRGSLGLLCDNGSAVFRGLTIEPLAGDR
jgi:hypothetical protein